MSTSEQSKITLLILIIPLKEAVKFLGIGESLLKTKLEPFTYNNQTYVQLTI